MNRNPTDVTISLGEYRYCGVTNGRSTATLSEGGIRRRGRELYEQKIRPQVAGARGKIVAIDIETGDFELADNGLKAAQALLARRPHAQIWVERIGYRGVHRFGRRVGDLP